MRKVLKLLALVACSAALCGTMAGCVSYYGPMNRSDQPPPKIELKEKEAGAK